MTFCFTLTNPYRPECYLFGLPLDHIALTTVIAAP